MDRIHCFRVRQFVTYLKALSFVNQLREQIRQGLHRCVGWFAGVAVRGGEQGLAQRRPVNLQVVEVSQDEAPFMEIEGGRARVPRANLLNLEEVRGPRRMAGRMANQE